MKQTKFVIVSLPGSQFSQRFLECWTNALMVLTASKKYDIMVTYGVHSFVTFARMRTMQLDVRRGKDQKPFPGVPYDVWVTIDSDVIFTPDQLMMLIDSTDRHPVVSGMYLMACGQEYAITVQRKRYQPSFVTPTQIEMWRKSHPGQDFLQVDYAGMGFFAARREALEAIPYPYFWRDIEEVVMDGKVLRDQGTEDVNFCLNLKEAGYPVHVHTGLRVGHEKLRVL
jgi:cellulose synthase/poly-beta-1,6-N-acetylglucosamine synthase-like glycosyltransferase